MGSEDISAVLFLHREVHTGQTDPSLGPICSSLTPFPSGGKDETISVSALCTKLPGLYLPCILLISLLGYTDYFSSSHWPCGTFIQPLTLVLISSGWAHRGWKKHTWKFGTELVWRRWQCNVNSDHPNSHCCHQNYWFFSFTQKKRAMTKTFSMPLLWALVEH